jgi:hypothetical protein
LNMAAETPSLRSPHEEVEAVMKVQSGVWRENGVESSSNVEFGANLEPRGWEGVRGLWPSTLMVSHDLLFFCFPRFESSRF